MQRFEGKTVLLTGAASGIGRETAPRFASEGAEVYGADVNEAGLKETAEQVAQAGGSMQFGRHDLTKRGDCFGAVESAVAAFGKLDVLGNIAGATKFHHFHEMPEEDWHFTIGLNLSGVAFTAQAALPHLIETQGALVNVASVAGVVGQAYTVAYCAAKGGVVMLTKSLAAEYIKTGVRISAVAPGGVKTPLNEKIDFPDEIDWDLVKRYMGQRGLCGPDEIAAAIAYLASHEARFVHGTILSIDGGIAST